MPRKFLFDDGSFPPSKEAKEAANAALKDEIERIEPFAEGTEPYSNITVINYGRLIDEWFDKLYAEKLQPNEEQMATLQAVQQRVLLETELQNESPWIQRSNLRRRIEDPHEEPMRGLILGFPSTGKSEVITGFAGYLQKLWRGNTANNFCVSLCKTALLTKWEE